MAPWDIALKWCQSQRMDCGERLKTGLKKKKNFTDNVQGWDKKKICELCYSSNP